MNFRKNIEKKVFNLILTQSKVTIYAYTYISKYNGFSRPFPTFVLASLVIVLGSLVT